MNPNSNNPQGSDALPARRERDPNNTDGPAAPKQVCRYPPDDAELFGRVKIILAQHLANEKQRGGSILNKFRVVAGRAYNEKYLGAKIADVDAAFVLLIFKAFNDVTNVPAAGQTVVDLVFKEWCVFVCTNGIAFVPEIAQLLKLLLTSTEAALNQWENSRSKSFRQYAEELMATRATLPVDTLCAAVLVSAASTPSLSSSRYLVPIHRVPNDDVVRGLAGSNMQHPKIESGCVNIGTGSSGIGKTFFSTHCAKGDDNVLLYSLPYLPGSSSSQVDIPTAGDSLQRNDETTNLFIRLIRNSIAHRNTSTKTATPATVKSDANEFLTRDYELHKHGNVPLWDPAKASSPPLRNVFIVLDEFGRFKNFIRGICRVWPDDLRGWVSRELGVPKENIFLIVAGTGSENFQKSAVGSLPKTYNLFTMKADVIFSETLLHLRREGDKRNPENNWKEIASSLIRLLYDETTGPDGNPVLKQKPTDASSHRFLELVQGNSRCAAVAIDIIGKSIVGNAAFQLPDEQRCGLLRTCLSSWASEIILRFAETSGVDGFVKPCNSGVQEDGGHESCGVPGGLLR